MISVIVAVYNGGAFLPTCLDSLLQQTYGDFEVLCVDDASTDNSVQVIREYMSRDSRIHLLSLSVNQGQAIARNTALATAQGDIIVILDADDWLAIDALQCISDTFEEYPATDCAVYRCVLVDGDGAERDYGGYAFTVLPGPMAARLSLSWQIHGCYAARKTLYDRYPFDTTCRVYSDDNTTRVHYYLSREVRQIEARYYYLQHPQSVTHTVSTNKLLYLRAAESMRATLHTLHCDDEMVALYENERWKIIIDGYFYYYCHRRKFNNEQRAFCIDTIRQSWIATQTEQIDKHLRRKFGYRPMRHSWTLFRLQEELYFLLRQLLGKNTPCE